jgi:hypothetical protein
LAGYEIRAKIYSNALATLLSLIGINIAFHLLPWAAFTYYNVILCSKKSFRGRKDEDA